MIKEKIFSPLVSIIIPVYNGANYLSEAIDSALAQTYKNIEILVINDGSNDHGATEKIAKSYGDKIRYFSKENGGVATALNLGIKKMKGEYFSWLSHDDIYYPNKVAVQVEFLDSLENKEVFLYADYALLRGKKLSPVNLDHETLERKEKYSLLRGAVNGITVLIPKSILDAVGEFDATLRCTQDYDLWRKIQNKYKFVHMKETVSITRIHSRQDSVLSPSALSEGNILWIDMINTLPDDVKIKYEYTLYNFYYEMVKFLKTTPYADTMKYCQAKLNDLERNDWLEENKRKVSIIMPFYNRVGPALISIQSALSQTYKNIEILLVDDRSSDDISKIEELVKTDKRIKLIRMSKNSGPAAARNIGMKQASGDYIAFLDSDDQYIIDKIETQLLMMLKHNLDMSHTAYIRRCIDGNDVEIHEKWLSGVVVPRVASNCPIATPTVMIRRDFLEYHNLWFREDIRIGEDTCFWLEIAKRTELLMVDTPLTIVNVGEESHSVDAKKRAIGLKNILEYEMSDDYYRECITELAKLSKAFFDATEDAIRQSRSKLKYKDLRLSNPSSIQERIAANIKESIPYRAARKMRRDGPKGVIAATRKRLRGEE